MKQRSPRETIAIAKRLCAAAELPEVDTLSQLSGGRNNQIFRVSFSSPDAEPALLKLYFKSPLDMRDRQRHEQLFSEFAWNCGVRCIPRLLASDAGAGANLFQFISGRPFQPGEVTSQHVEQATAFVIQLNPNSDQYTAELPPASEACFDLHSHLRLVQQRVDRCRKITQPDAMAFVEDELLPAWESLQQALISSGDSKTTIIIASPSDFGFHNAILKSDSDIVFHDFEYAGRDDPAKLISDFFHQPQRPAPLEAFAPMAQALDEYLQADGEIISRANQLLPLFGVKWACIVLNPLLPDGASRRKFAGSHQLPDRLIQRARWVLYRSRQAV